MDDHSTISPYVGDEPDGPWREIGELTDCGPLMVELAQRQPSTVRLLEVFAAGLITERIGGGAADHRSGPPSYRAYWGHGHPGHRGGGDRRDAPDRSSDPGEAGYVPSRAEPLVDPDGNES